MFIKYQHARNATVGVSFAGLIAGLAIAAAPGEPPPTRPDKVAERWPAPPADPHAAERASALVPTDGDVISFVARGSNGEAKLKDALGASSPWKVNVYDDDQDGVWDRVKVDRDRDDTWDSSWTFADGRWSEDGRQRVWQGDGWVAAGAAPVAPVKAEVPTDAAVMALVTTGSKGEAKLKDALGGSSPWKVNVYDDDQDGAWDRVKIDRDRDDAWDSAWHAKSGQWLEDGTGRAWRDGGWVDPAAAAPAAGEGAAALAAAKAMAGRATAKKIKDLTRGSGAKINLYDDDGDGAWDRAKIDADRDDTWDEKLSRKGHAIERSVEASGEVWVLDGGTWKRKD